MRPTTHDPRSCMGGVSLRRRRRCQCPRLHAEQDPHGAALGLRGRDRSAPCVCAARRHLASAQRPPPRGAGDLDAAQGDPAATSQLPGHRELHRRLDQRVPHYRRTTPGTWVEELHRLPGGRQPSSSTRSSSAGLCVGVGGWCGGKGTWQRPGDEWYAGSLLGLGAAPGRQSLMVDFRRVPSKANVAHAVSRDDFARARLPRSHTLAKSIDDLCYAVDEASVLLHRLLSWRVVGLGAPGGQWC